MRPILTRLCCFSIISIPNWARQVAMKGGLSSARNDIGSLEQKFKKVYIESKYTARGIGEKIRRMGRLDAQLFIQQR